MIRLTTSAWAREEVLKWVETHDDSHILIAEAPVVGNRFSDWMCIKNDAVEDFLSSDNCVFVIPVASNDVRTKIAQRRSERMEVWHVIVCLYQSIIHALLTLLFVLCYYCLQKPIHANEAHDCPVWLMDHHVQELSEVHAILEQGLPLEAATVGSIQNRIAKRGEKKEKKMLPYDSAMYEEVWTHMMRHRPTTVLHMTKLLNTDLFSAYDYSETCQPKIIKPSQDDIDAFFARTIKRYQHLSVGDRDKALAQQCDAWFVS